MNWIPNIFRRRKLYDDLSDEMRLHLEERVEHLLSEGLSPEEAERQACIAFGNLAMVEERSREVWQWPTLESMGPMRASRFGGSGIPPDSRSRRLQPWHWRSAPTP